MTKTICAKCDHSKFLRSKAHPDGGHWRCYAPLPATLNLVTGESYRGSMSCSELNDGNCLFFKEKVVKPICVECVYLDSMAYKDKMLPTHDWVCKAKWATEQINPVTGKLIPEVYLCERMNDGKCQRFVELLEDDRPGDEPQTYKLEKPLVSGNLEMATDKDRVRAKPEKFEKLVRKRLYRIHWILYIIMCIAGYFAVVDFGKAIIDWSMQ